MTNEQIASRLEEAASLLEEQDANPYRVRAYRNVAEFIRSFKKSVAGVAIEGGPDALKAFPGIGEGIARSIYTLVLTGRLPLLEQLKGESDPIALFASAPGIGKTLARRIYEELGIESLEDLESATYDGRLSTVEGIGKKRAAGIRDALKGRLDRLRGPYRRGSHNQPPIAELLDVDREYRAKAEAGRLRKIAPRRFNLTHEAWLPVLHTTRGKRHYTALFSNTELAHKLGKTRDWVILYYDGAGGEQQCTVITAQRGPLKGKRVVRGREEECARYYGLETDSTKRKSKRQ